MKLSVVTVEAKTWASLGRPKEEDYRLASKKFCQTIRRFMGGKQCSTNTVHREGVERLTWTGNVLQWKEDLKDHLSPVVSPSAEGAEAEGSGRAYQLPKLKTPRWLESSAGVRR